MVNNRSTTEARFNAIVRAIRAVPVGQVAGYGEIARRAGFPGRARLVAQVLGKHCAPDLPWHRIVRSDGSIAFERDSRSWHEQCERLRAEGIKVANGKVKGQRAASTLDEHLWGQPD